MNTPLDIYPAWPSGLKRCFTGRGVAWVRIPLENYITHGNLILQKPFLHFRARLNCDVEQNCFCHVVDHTKYINTLYHFFLICTCQVRYLPVNVLNPKGFPES